MTVFPLYLMKDDDQNELFLGGDNAPNFAPVFLSLLANHFKIAWSVSTVNKSMMKKPATELEETGC